MGEITPKHIQAIIINPFYAIQVFSELVETHTPAMHDEDWVKGNSSLIQEMGAEEWLGSLIDVLQGNPAHELVNPYHAINIDPMFAAEHPAIVSEELWIQGNVMLLQQLGTEPWLQLLLNVLEGDFITAEDMGLTTPSADRIRYQTRRRWVRKRKKFKR